MEIFEYFAGVEDVVNFYIRAINAIITTLHQEQQNLI